MMDERVTDFGGAGIGKSQLFEALVSRMCPPQAQAQRRGSDLLYLIDFGRSFSRSSLEGIRGIGKSAVAKQKVEGEPDELYQVYIELNRDGRYGTDEHFTASEANKLICRLSDAVAEFCGSTAQADANFDTEGQQVNVSEVRMVVIPGVAGNAISVEDMRHITGLSLRYDGRSAFIDIRWSPTRSLPTSSMRIRDFQHNGGNEYDPAQRDLAERVFDEAVQTVNSVQIAMGMPSLLHATPVKTDVPPQIEIKPVGVDPGEREDTLP